MNAIYRIIRRYISYRHKYKSTQASKDKVVQVYRDRIDELNKKNALLQKIVRSKNDSLAILNNRIEELKKKLEEAREKIRNR